FAWLFRWIPGMSRNNRVVMDVAAQNSLRLARPSPKKAAGICTKNPNWNKVAARPIADGWSAFLVQGLAVSTKSKPHLRKCEFTPAQV
ncbi:MAG: hypothetical protein KAH99_01075, partial [Verrucomicrobia bacterium]|nr:hypothetical protein [Verrucomicrobiota bacterium]